MGECDKISRILFFHKERIFHLLLGGLLSRDVCIAYFFDQDFHEHVSLLWMRPDRCTSGSIFFKIREFPGDVPGFLFSFLALIYVSCGLICVTLSPIAELCGKCTNPVHSIPDTITVKHQTLKLLFL